jgi:tetratricopeptide (TPR) repeat protein
MPILFLILTFLVWTGCGDPQARKERHLERGKEYLEAAKLKEAVIEFKNVLQIAPRDVQGHYHLALAYLRQGGTVNFQAGLKELRLAVEADPSFLDARIRMAGLYNLAREYDKARTEAEAVLAGQPDHFEALILLSESLDGLGKRSEAIATALTAVERHPKRTEPYLVLAALYERDKNGALAEKTYRNALEQIPASVETRLRLAEFYRRAGRTKESEAAYLDAIAARPKDTAPYLSLANLYRSVGDDSKAEEQLIRATEQGGESEEPWVFLGDFYRSRGKTEKAIEAYEKALAQKPDSVMALGRMADFALDRGETDTAEGWIGKILSAHPKDLGGRVLKGRVLIAQKRFKEAAVELLNVVRDEPGLAEAHYRLGLAYLGTGEDQAAKTALTEALRLSPGLTEASLALSGLHLRTGDDVLAIEEASKVVKARPLDVQARLILGQAYARNKQASKGLEQFREVTRLAPNEPKGFYYAGLVYRAQRKEAEALNAFERALSADSGFIEALDQIVGIHLSNQEAKKAVSRSLEQIEKRPEDARLHLLLGKLYAALQDYTRAEPSYKKAIALDPNLPAAYMHLGRLYAVTKRYEKAQAEFESVVKSNPNETAAYMMLGTLQDAQGRYDLAKPYYEKALQINPRFAPAANNLAWNTTEHGGNIDVALSLAEQAREQLPYDPLIADTLGWIYYKKNANLKAITLLKESAEKLRDQPVVRYHLGMAYHKQGNKEAAHIELEAALKLNPDFEGAEEARKALNE